MFKFISSEHAHIPSNIPTHLHIASVSPLTIKWAQIVDFLYNFTNFDVVLTIFNPSLRNSHIEDKI